MDVYEELIRERDAGRSCALAVIVNATGSIPSYETAKMLVREDGSIVGTVGGGAGEAAVIREAKEAIASGRPRMVSFDLHENPRMDLGMVCGGSLNVFIEAIRPAPVAYLFGAGHVGCLTAQAAKLARIEVEVIDDRPEFANKERFPDARAIHAGEIGGDAGGAEAEQPFADLHRHARARVGRARLALGGRYARRLHRHDRFAAESAVRLRQAETGRGHRRAVRPRPRARRLGYRRRDAGRNRHFGRRRNGRHDPQVGRRASGDAQHARSRRGDRAQNPHNRSREAATRLRKSALARRQGRPDRRRGRRNSEGETT